MRGGAGRRSRRHFLAAAGGGGGRGAPARVAAAPPRSAGPAPLSPEGPRGCPAPQRCRGALSRDTPGVYVALGPCQRRVSSRRFKAPSSAPGRPGQRGQSPPGAAALGGASRAHKAG